MKIQCDVCEKKEASAFCSADEAVLCDGCDHRVHYVNKLASKHQRFSLHHPSFEDTPLCDICQERRAFLFCREHRAILCRECDAPIHSANEYTQSHNRFLLTAVSISASSTTYPNSSPISTASSKPDSENHKSVTLSSSDHGMTSNHSYFSDTTKSITTKTTQYYDQNNEDYLSSTSTTPPEYLMENIPGWRLDNLLDSPYSPV